MSYRLRTIAHEDIPPAARLLEAAYGPNRGFEPRLRSLVAIEPEGWIVAEAEAGSLVGIGGFVVFDRCAYIGLMGVPPEAQRRGIGAAVFEEVLARCEARGCGLLLLDASKAGAPLYEKYSFRDHGTGLTFAIAPRREAPAGGEVRVAPADEALAKEIAGFDAEHFGADRSALVRGLLRDSSGRAFVARAAGGEIAGYAVGQARSIGPCVARSAEAARALVERVLALPYEGSVTWLAGSQNEEAIALARSLDAAHTRTHRHMRRGDEALLASDWSRLFAKASFAVG